MKSFPDFHFLRQCRQCWQCRQCDSKVNCLWPGGVRHDPQLGFIGKTVLLTVSHFNRGTVEREMNQTQGSKHYFLFWKSLRKRNYGRERFGEFSRSHSGLRCLLRQFHKAISIRISWFGDDRRYDLVNFMRRFPAC